MGQIIEFPGRTRPVVHPQPDGSFSVSVPSALAQSAIDAYLASTPWTVGEQSFIFDDWEPGETDEELLFFGWPHSLTDFL